MAITQQVVPSKLRHLQSFASSGTFYPPAGTTVVFVSVHGASGGGAGGNGRYSPNAGGAGGIGKISGGYVQVNPQAPHGVVIGAGGTGSAGGNNDARTGGTGGVTSFDGAIFSNGGAGGNNAGYGGGNAGAAGTTTAQTALTTLSPSNNAVVRVTTFNTSGTNVAGGVTGTSNGAGASGQNGIVHIYGY
jgi:hypothetical protein